MSSRSRSGTVCWCRSIWCSAQCCRIQRCRSILAVRLQCLRLGSHPQQCVLGVLVIMFPIHGAFFQKAMLSRGSARRFLLMVAAPAAFFPCTVWCLLYVPDHAIAWEAEHAVWLGCMLPEYAISLLRARRCLVYSHWHAPCAFHGIVIQYGSYTCALLMLLLACLAGLFYSLLERGAFHSSCG